MERQEARRSRCSGSTNRMRTRPALCGSRRACTGTRFPPRRIRWVADGPTLFAGVGTMAIWDILWASFARTHDKILVGRTNTPWPGSLGGMGSTQGDGSQQGARHGLQARCLPVTVKLPIHGPVGGVKHNPGPDSNCKLCQASDKAVSRLIFPHRPHSQAHAYLSSVATSPQRRLPTLVLVIVTLWYRVGNFLKTTGFCCIQAVRTLQSWFILENHQFNKS